MKERHNLILHFDGGARGNPGPAAAGVVLRDQNGKSILEAGYLLGPMTNNQAEYSALLIGVRAANQWGAEQLTVYSDSELLVRQLTGDYRVKSHRLMPLFDDVQRQLLEVGLWRIHHVARHENRRADELVNRALDADEDVIEVQLSDAPPPLTPRADRAVADAATAGRASGDKSARVLVEMVSEARGRPCPTSCIGGSRYIVEDVLPAGLNLDVAAKVIEAVNTVRERAQSGGNIQPVIITCARCGASFQISLDAV